MVERRISGDFAGAAEQYSRAKLLPPYALQSQLPQATMTVERQQEAPLSDSEPIPLRPRPAGESHSAGRSAAPGGPGPSSASTAATSTGHHSTQVCFNRLELNEILAVYGRMVAVGEWRDYAIDMGREKAVFSVFRRATEYPLFRIEKNPRLARKQGAYSVVATTGLILKRGSDLKRVLEVFDKKLRLVN
jgi:hypothetical protein